MLKSILQPYIDVAADVSEICVVVHSIETGEEIAASYDIVVDISEHGELVISIAI